MNRFGMALVWMLVLCGSAGAHEITFSHVDVRLDRGETLLGVQLPIAALLHEQPSPLPAGTTEQTLRSNLLPADVQASLLTTRLRLGSGGGALPLTVGRIRPAGEDMALTASAPPPARWRFRRISSRRTRCTRRSPTSTAPGL